MIVNYGVIYHETTDFTGSEREAAATIVFCGALEQWMNEMEQRMEVYNNDILEIDVK